MKAEIISQLVYESYADWNHGGGDRIERIIIPEIPEAGNLAITMIDGKIHLWKNFEKDSTCELVRNVDIPEKVVEEVIKFMKTRDTLSLKFIHLFRKDG